MASSRRRNRVLAALAITLLLGACLVLIETLLQTHFRITKGYWLLLDRTNFAVPYVKPVNDRREYSLRENASDGRHRINSKGFRGAEIDSRSNAPLICVIGDSVPFGAGVADEETFPAHLQKALRASGSAVQVLNGGVASYNLRQSFDRWRIDIAPAYRCRLLLVNAANDVSLIDYFGEKWTPDVTWAQARFDIATNRIAISLYASVVQRRLQAAAQIGSLSEQEQRRFVDVVLTSVGQAVDEAVAQNLPVVILPISPCYATGRVEDTDSREACHGYPDYAALARRWQPLIAMLNAGLKALAARKGIHYLPVDEFFNRRGRAGMFVDFIHFSNAGNHEIAQFILEFVHDKGLLQ
jgi:GDSL-like Lipase/Acylhydrolase family